MSELNAMIEMAITSAAETLKRKGYGMACLDLTLEDGSKALCVYAFDQDVVRGLRAHVRSSARRHAASRTARAGRRGA